MLSRGAVHPFPALEWQPERVTGWSDYHSRASVLVCACEGRSPQEIFLACALGMAPRLTRHPLWCRPQQTGWTMAETRIALVTGANRGIGLAIVRQLSRLGVITILASRNLDKGRAAAEDLAAEGFEVPVIALDVEDGHSVLSAVAEAVRMFGRLDILVNNAAILIDGPGGFKASLFELTDETLKRTFETNLAGPIRMTQAVVPIMRQTGYGRIVNLSSRAGQLAEMGSGFPAYRMSKTAVNALTRITAAEIGSGNIKVNSVCPGWVKTDMGGAEADRTAEQGAETAVWLATLPDDGPTGGFFRDKKPIPW